MLRLSQPNVDLFVPSGIALKAALSHTTLLAVGAHQDDIPFMAFDGIVRAYGSASEFFTGVTVTNGSGSARSGPYANFSDTEMIAVRRREDNYAARLGKYNAMLQLDHPSSNVKDPRNTSVVDDLEEILREAQPREIYTHCLTDKHDAHVGVALKLVAAIRRLPMDMRPKRLIGCEVWRDLDWLCDSHKVIMDVSGHDDLAQQLMAVYESQIKGGKRYDLAVEGRRRANATFLNSLEIDTATSVIFGMDMTCLIDESDFSPNMLIGRLIGSFRDEVEDRFPQKVI